MVHLGCCKGYERLCWASRFRRLDVWFRLGVVKAIGYLKLC